MEISDRSPALPIDIQVGDFEELERIMRQQGVASALEWMERKFRHLEHYPQLFEVLKMKCRNRLGLKLVSDPAAEQLDEPTQRLLEEGLLSACREVGLLLWRKGELTQGWMYLQALGSHPETAQALEQFPVDEDNVDALIDIAISQGAAPVLGYRLLIQKYGTCNAITTFDMQATRFDAATQRQMAATLLRHLYHELIRNILHSLQSRRGERSTSDVPFELAGELTLAQLLKAYPQASARHGHQIDATHLASVVRIAKLVRDPADLQMALELTRYGHELHPDFQYPGLPPFEDTYVDHEIYHQVQLGQQVEAGLQHFRSKCETVSTERFGSIAYETLADLLIQLGRRTEAIQLLAEHVWGKLQPSGLIGNVFLIPQTEIERQQLRDYFRSRQDLLSFGMSLF